jgi:hypothetical protein
VEGAIIASDDGTEVNHMTRTINAIGDRLLGLFVPSVKASADPCGQEYYVFCYCTPLGGYHKHCCSKGGCTGCYRYGNFC